MAVGRLSSRIVDIPGKGITDAVFHRDVPGARQSLNRCRRYVPHPPVRVKSCKMPRHVPTELRHHPFRHLLELFLRAVETRDEQGRDFETCLCFVLHIDKRIQHRLQMGVSDLMVEIFGEAFQVYVGGVHMAKEFGTRLRAHIACCHRDALDTAFMAGDRRVHSVFMKIVGSL
jgi:hypothetical protein